MTNENKHIAVPHTVLQVIEEFVEVMRADPDIPDDAINRLEILLRKGTVPKPDDINEALFEPSKENKI